MTRAIPLTPILNMSRIIRTVLPLAALLGACAGAVHAQTKMAEPTALLDQQHCLFCHTSNAPFLAPSFHEIADRYRKVPDASVMLEQKLRLGGRAHWGDKSMPVPDDRGGPLSPEDAHTLVRWVMTQ